MHIKTAVFIDSCSCDTNKENELDPNRFFSCSHPLFQNIGEQTKTLRIETSVQNNYQRQLTFVYGDHTVVLSDIQTISVDNKHVKQLPYYTTEFSIRQGTSQFILIESHDLTVAYDGNAVYVTLESYYRERIRGLCGAFDYNERGDLRLPNGKLTCDTHIFSRAYLLNDTKQSSEEKLPEKYDRSAAVCFLFISCFQNEFVLLLG